MDPGVRRDDVALEVTQFPLGGSQKIGIVLT
jgi:hypothetical protein